MDEEVDMRIHCTRDAVVQKKDHFELFLPFVFVVFFCLGLTSCKGGSPSAAIHFSPDGSTIAYTYADRIDLPLPPEVPTLHSTVYLQWCPMDRIKSYQSMKIDSYGKSYGSFVQDQFALLFSPDSRHIAVKSPRYLEVVDLENQTRHRLTGPDELVTSMGWLGNKEMVYVVHKKTGSEKHGAGSTRQIFRHTIGESPGKRLLLYEQFDYRGNYHDYVSPTGEYVVFMSQGYSDGFFYLLNVQAGKVEAFSEKKAKCQAVSWKPDGSCVFCLSSTGAMLLYPQEGRIKDLSDNYDNAFRRHLAFAPEIDPRWTPDGRFIVINSTKMGGSLVCPDPWRVVPLGKLLVGYLEEKENQRVYRDPQDSYPILYVQPYPGWVRIWLCLVTDKKPTMRGETVVLERMNYLVDYEGQRFIPMKPSFSPGGAWTITPDGKKMVYFNAMIPKAISLEEEPVHLPGNN
jgi:hypothetical protein